MPKTPEKEISDEDNSSSSTKNANSQQQLPRITEKNSPATIQRPSRLSTASSLKQFVRTYLERSRTQSQQSLTTKPNTARSAKDSGPNSRKDAEELRRKLTNLQGDARGWDIYLIALDDIIQVLAKTAK